MPRKRWLTDKEYDFVYDRVPRLCVDLVIRTKEGLLLAWRDIAPYRNAWHLPGGRVNLGESIAQAARRIAREEAGVRIRPGKLLGYAEFPRERQFGKRRHSVSIVLLADSIGRTSRTQSMRTDTFTKAPAHLHTVHGRFLKSVGAWKLFTP